MGVVRRLLAGVSELLAGSTIEVSCPRRAVEVRWSLAGSRFLAATGRQLNVLDAGSALGDGDTQVAGSILLRCKL